VNELPAGNVTLLFSDIEGSTRLLEQLGERYTDVLGEHRRVIREAIGPHGGAEVATVGDGFFAAFTSAAEAVEATAEAQRALAVTPVKVRMGLHTGEAAVTSEGYVGMDVHRAARIAAAAHGGQVVLSEQTRALYDGELELRDLGDHRLKDLTEPLRLFQLGRNEFPPLRSLSQARLPAELDPLVGRKRELADLLRLLTREGARVVTITGPGGIGKTRLALATAAELVESFERGATLVELAAIRDPELVLPAIAEGIGVEGDLSAQLGDEERLLLLDNLEQVIDVAPRLAELLGGSPGLVVLATSREPLRIAGEREFPLRPLPEAPAVELFRQRAEAAAPEFAADYEQLAEICRRLDSLPLAIELAAARVKLLTPADLLSRLDRRLPILTGGRRDLPERQQTLRATIQWSYELLEPDEQALFARLAVFSGGWTMDAAEAVCGADLDTLGSLLDKSLVRRDEQRFSMLETIREYAAELLEASGEPEEVRRRHAEYILGLAESVEREYLGESQARLREHYRADWDNIRAALGWCLDRGEIELGLRIAGALTLIWLQLSVAPEGERWLTELLARAEGVDPSVRATALATLGMVAGVQNEVDLAERSSSEALEHFRAAGHEAGIAWTLSTLAVAPLERGEPEAAAPMLDEAEALHRKLGNDGGIRRILHLRGLQAVLVDDLAGASELLRESGELSAAAGDEFSAASSFHSLGDVLLAAGDPGAAAGSYARALEIAARTGADRLVCYCVAGLAAVAAERGDAAEAARLWGFAEAYEARLGFSMRWRTLYEERLAGLLESQRDAYRAGRELDLQNAVDLAVQAS
jgi:predicted ATPase/class 3 adenylate cyclase